MSVDPDCDGPPAALERTLQGLPVFVPEVLCQQACDPVQQKGIKMARRKFWGWGKVGEGFSDEDMKPFEAQYAAAFGVDGFSVRPFPSIDEIEIDPPRLAPPASLARICTADKWERLVHTFGCSFHEQVRIMDRDFEGAPDLVARPRDERDVAALLDWCAVAQAAAIPFGGGSSVVGGVHPAVGDHFRGTVSIDMGAMDRVLEVDRTSRAARIQAGVYGPHLESQLRPHGLTLRYFPQSFEYSTLGGWIATRGGGHFATLLTHIDDLTESVRAVTPSGIHDSFRLPGSGAGPSPDRLFLGSEGIFGVITEAWMRLQDRPTFRAGQSIGFRRFVDGAEAVRAIAQAGLYPANLRLLDHNEVKWSGTGDGSVAVLVLGFENADHPLDSWMSRALECCRDHGGLPLDGSGDGGDAAIRWREAFIKGGHMREMLTARAIIRETFESAITWDRFEAFHHDVTRATETALKEATGRPGIVACRFTHVYPDGPAPYYTFIGQGEPGHLSAQYDTVKNAVSDAIIEGGGTITHHHAVGRDHMPWYGRQRSEVFATALKGVKAALDPDGIMNPGVLVP